MRRSSFPSPTAPVLTDRKSENALSASIGGSPIRPRRSTWIPLYISHMPRHVRWHRMRVALVVALIIIFAGVALDSLLSANWALDDGLLLAAAAVIAFALLLTRGRGESEAR